MNEKIIIAVSIIGGFVIFLPYLSEESSQGMPAPGCEQVELDYTIKNGEFHRMCYFKHVPSLLIETNMISDGQIEIIVPRSLVYSLSQDCESRDLILLINDKESINVNIVNTPKSRIITLDFPQGQNTIEFIGTYTLDVRIHDYCGVIYGYSSKYLPPLKQINNDISSKGVLCNDGLELILKSTDNSPACVKPVTAEKLIARGWGIS